MLAHFKKERLGSEEAGYRGCRWGIQAPRLTAVHLPHLPIVELGQGNGRRGCNRAG